MPAARKKVTAKVSAAPAPTEWWVEVVPQRKQDGEIHRMGPFASERTAERCESGVERNLDHERFYTRVTSGPAGKP